MSKMLICLTCCIMVLGLATGASAQLVAHYKLDETEGTVAADASGNGFDGTVNGIPEWTEGNVDGALEFFGTENVTLPAAAMGLTSYTGTVAFWMQSNVPTQIYTMFWGGDNTTGGGFGPENEFHIHLESEVGGTWIGGELSFYLRADPNPNVHLHSDPQKATQDDPNPGGEPISPTLMGDLTWHHVAGVWDGDAGICKLFIDGFLIMEWPYVPTVFELNNMFLGQMANAGRTYTGKLDDVRIYANALSDDDVLNLALGLTDDVKSPEAKPEAFTLNQNYPNPFNPSTNISYSLEKNSHVTLKIYNVTGHEIATLVDNVQSAGSHQVTWNALHENNTQLASGIYFARLKAGAQTKAVRMLLMR